MRGQIFVVESGSYLPAAAPQFLEQLRGSVLGLHEDQDRWAHTLYQQLAHRDQLAVLTPDVDKLLFDRRRCAVPIDQTQISV